MFKRSVTQGEPFRFRVSDALDMPHRGMLLRLRLEEGRPSVADLAVGRVLVVGSPDGREREVAILDHSVTAGRQTQERLDRLREFDVVVARADSHIDDDPIEIGWSVRRPASS